MLSLGLVTAVTAAPTQGHSAALVHESTVHEQNKERDFSIFCVGNNNGCWPSSFLIGTQKGGTTAVAQFLVDNGLVLEGHQTEDSKMGGTSGLVGQATYAEKNESLPVGATMLKDGYFSAKEPHALDQFFVDNEHAKDYEYTRLYRSDGNGNQRSFLDATPNYLPSKNAPRILRERMPENMRIHAKFVAILREPISRALSWYNHVRSCAFTDACDLESLGAQCFRQVMSGLKHGSKPNFDATVRCAFNRPELGNFGREDEAMLEYGYYAKSIEKWSEERKNMLIVSYDRLDEDPDGTLQRIIKHYGLPNRPITAPIEHLNTQSSPNKIEVVQCDTLASLRVHYNPHNEQLYTQLAHDHNSGKSPDLEEPFRKFVVRIPCAEKQIEAQEEDLLKTWNSTDENAMNPPPRKSHDKELLDHGIYTCDGSGGCRGKLMHEERPILFGMMASDAEPERYEGQSATWCSKLKSCVCFGDTATTPNTGSHMLPVVDIMQYLMDRHGYPKWPLHSETHWPGYASAQLRFVPALHWMREKMLANEGENPHTHKFFGHAKWVILVDDDTYVFYANLVRILPTLGHNEEVYMGLVSPNEWLPTYLETSLMNEKNGMLLPGQIEWNEKFVAGGGSSIFSRAALTAMDTEFCVREMRPDGAWWQYQSDWAIAACALQKGLHPQGAVPGAFNQHVCLADGKQPFFCWQMADRTARNATGGLLSWDDPNVGGSGTKNIAESFLSLPATIHPVKQPDAMKYLFEKYKDSHKVMVSIETTTGKPQ
jgi:hypothetical protein